MENNGNAICKCDLQFIQLFKFDSNLIAFFFLIGDTRLGLMWSCMTLYNRPQICYKSALQSEWLMALVCIFVGCILITATIILLIISHWDRSVIPYARWVGFGASTYKKKNYV